HRSTGSDFENSSLAHVTDKEVSLPVQRHAGRAAASPGEFRYLPIWRELANDPVGSAAVHVALTIHGDAFGSFKPGGRDRNLIDTELLIRHDGSPFYSFLANSFERVSPYHSLRPGVQPVLPLIYHVSIRKQKVRRAYEIWSSPRWRRGAAQQSSRTANRTV